MTSLTEQDAARQTEFVTREYHQVRVAELQRLKLDAEADRDRLAAEVASAHGLLARAEAAEARVVELQRDLERASLGTAPPPLGTATPRNAAARIVEP